MNEPKKMLILEGKKTKIQDLSGLRFGKLSVLDFGGRIGSARKAAWNTVCECGTNGLVSSDNLRSGVVKSCGCNHSNRGSHKMSNTRQYGIWCGIIRRVEDPDNQYYKDVKICQRWRNDFQDFWNDMKESYRDGLTIDRKDNKGHYSCGQCEECHKNGWPMNCRWITHAEQMHNTSQNHIVSWEGESMTLTRLCEKMGRSFNSVFARLKLGWPLKDAILRPKFTRRSSFLV